MSAETFSVRVGRSKLIHSAFVARHRPGTTLLETVCGFRGYQGWISRAGLEPVSCKNCLRRLAALSSEDATRPTGDGENAA